MRFLTLGEVLALHRRILAESGGRAGIRDLGAIASALSQPKPRYDRKGTEGTFHAVSGTGKYQGMAVDGSYVIMRFPSRPGILQGCSQNKGRWERQ